MSDSTKSDLAPWILNSEDLIEEFLSAAARGHSSLRETWLAREALQSIVRLVRAEQLLEIRRSVNRLVPTPVRPQTAKRPKTRRNQRKQPGQTQFAFGRED